MMWVDDVSELNEGCRDNFADSTLLFTVDDVDYTCRAIFDAPHDKIEPTGQGTVGITSYAPSATYNLDDLAEHPKNNDHVIITRDLPGGLTAAPVEYIVTDVQPSGFGSTKLVLMEAI